MARIGAVREHLARVRKPMPKRGTIFPGQCTATSRRSGERCGAYALKGRPVCRAHGARAGRPKKDGTPPASRSISPQAQAPTEPTLKDQLRRQRRAQAAALCASFNIWELDGPTRATALAIYDQLCIGRRVVGHRAKVAQAIAAKHALGAYPRVFDFDCEAAALLGSRR